jgi:glucosamine--fructose-6-phosphate aminotransferase (isomerizing)
MTLPPAGPVPRPDQPERPGSDLAREAAQVPERARAQLERNRAAFAALGERLRARRPRLVATCARGSSGHAAAYGKHLVETALGLPVAAIGPGVASVYGARLDLRDALFVAVSQSGRSPDLLRLTEAARAGGALVVGMVNDEAAPLASLCEVVLPLCAGQERSVAATKSHLLACLGFLSLAAHWSGDGALTEAAEGAPGAMAAAAGLDWWPALRTLAGARGLFVLGRGPGHGAALEVALKLKETCGLHAEAFSAAEAMHGPIALAGPDLPVLALGQDDGTAASVRLAVERMAASGSPAWSVLEAAGAGALPALPGLHPALAPLCQVQGFYLALDRLALARGLDPDRPRNLTKVTETR